MKMGKHHKSMDFGGKKRGSDKNDKQQKLGHLPEEMMAYYRQVSATLEAGFDDDDPTVKRNFLDNVFAALKDEGVKASQNQTVSRILESLFPHSEPIHLRMFFCQFCQQLTTISFDRFASHVLQSLIQYLPTMYDDENLKEEDLDSLKNSIKQLCKHVKSHINRFMTDTYGSHVLRALLEIMGGVHVKEEVIRSHMSRDQQRGSETKTHFPVSKQLSDKFEKQFKTIKNKVISSCDYAAHLSDPNYCPVLQTVLLILHKSNLQEYDDLSHTILEKTCPPLTAIDKEDLSKNLPAVVQDVVGSYLIELIVSLSSQKEGSTIYQDHFKGKLLYFAVHPVANFILQKLLSCVSSPQILKEIVEETSAFLEDVLAVGHIGVITKLAEACKRLQAHQETFIKAVSKAFHCDEPEDRRIKLAVLIAVMKTYETFCEPATKETTTTEGEETVNDSVKPPPNVLTTVNFHGSLILQNMLHFTRPKPVVIGLLALSSAELSVLASHTSGSHVVESFFSSTTVWDRSKDEFLKKLKGYYAQIACTKNGSRCLEGIWKSCVMKNKILIAEELIKGGDRIRSDKFGHFLYNNFALMKFSTRKKEWIDVQSGIKKKQQMLQAILEGGSSKKNRKRKIFERTDDQAEKLDEATPSKQKPKLQVSETNENTNTNSNEVQEKKKGRKKLNKKKRIKLKKEMRKIRAAN